MLAKHPPPPARTREIVLFEIDFFAAMPLERSDALVLKTVDFSESSLIVTLFTRKYGKIQAIAKGGRRLKSSFENALDILSQVFVAFIRKHTDSLDILTEAKRQKRFSPTSQNFAGLYAGYYLIELLNLGTAEYDPMPELYDKAAAAIDSFAEGTGVMRALILFEWQFLTVLGLQPSLDRCAECGEPAGTATIAATREEYRPVRFGLLSGGVVCNQCRPTQAVQISAAAFATMLQITGVSVSATTTLVVPSPLILPDSAGSSGSSSKRVIREIRGLLSRYISAVLERPPKMHRYFGIIEKYDRDTFSLPVS